MMYADYDTYREVFGGSASEEEFDRAIPLACRLIDSAVTGVDGVSKLRLAPPVDKADTDAVAVCACAVADLLVRTAARERAADGAVTPGMSADGVLAGEIASVSSGSESISFRAQDRMRSAADRAASDPSDRRLIVSQIIAEMLSGVRDGNGVSLLYMGKYPPGMLRESGGGD